MTWIIARAPRAPGTNLHGLFQMLLASGDDLSDKSKLGFRSLDISFGNRAILDCVEKGLLDILGKSAQGATLYFIEVKGGMKLSRIPDDPDGFAAALHAIFGPGSAELLKSVLRELRLKETMVGQEKHLHDFADAIERAVKSVEAGLV